MHVTGEPTNITIYKETHDGKSRFLVSYYDAACRRHRQRCSGYAKADALAGKIKKEIKTGGWDSLTLRGREKHAYEQARDSLRAGGKPLDLVVHEYVEANKTLNGFSLVEAARSFIQRQAQKLTPKSVPEIVPELLDDMQRKGRSKSYLRDLRTRLGRFGENFSCPLSSISTAEIDQYIHDLAGKERYRNNVLQTIGTLFSFAKKRGYVCRDQRCNELRGQTQRDRGLYTHGSGENAQSSQSPGSTCLSFDLLCRSAWCGIRTPGLERHQIRGGLHSRQSGQFENWNAPRAAHPGQPSGLVDAPPPGVWPRGALQECIRSISTGGKEGRPPMEAQRA